MARPKSIAPRLSLKYLPAKDCYFVELFVHNGAGGRPRKSLRTNDPDKAAAMFEVFRASVLPSWLAELKIGQAAEGDPFESSDPGIAPMLAWYVETHLPYLGRAPKTISSARSVLESFVAFGEAEGVVRFSDLSSFAIQRWQIWRGEHSTRMRSPGPSAAELTTLRSFVRAVMENHPGVEVERLNYNIPARRRGSRYRALEVDELRSLLAAVSEHAPEISLVVHWLAFTGWRAGDALAFTWEMIGDDGAIRFVAAKTKNEVSVPVTKQMRAVLEVAAAGRARVSGPVFVNAKGQAFTYNQFQHRLKWVSTTFCGVNIRARDLRKTLNTLLIEQGTDVKTATALLGNVSDTVTLQNYTQVNAAHMARELGRVSASIGASLPALPDRR